MAFELGDTEARMERFHHKTSGLGVIEMHFCWFKGQGKSLGFYCSLQPRPNYKNNERQ